MRWLRIRYTLSRAGRPVLLSATLLGGCGSSLKVDAAADTAAPSDVSVGVAADQALSDGVSSQRDTGQRDAQVVDIPLPTDTFFAPDARTVPMPSFDGAGAPYTECIDIDAGADAGLGLAGAQAARVTLDWASTVTCIGRVSLAPEIAGLVVGLPTVDVIDQHPSTASNPTISNMRADGGGYAFDANWTDRDPRTQCYVGGPLDWTFRTTLRLQCGGRERTVESFTTVALCDGFRWASSGEACDECNMICEMAPSPLVPGHSDDDLPLGAALGVVIRPLARVGGALVLLAEHAPKPGLRYAWQATAGTLEQIDSDVVLWRLPSSASREAHLAQVAITGSDFATVASYRSDQRIA